MQNGASARSPAVFAVMLLGRIGWREGHRVAEPEALIEPQRLNGAGPGATLHLCETVEVRAVLHVGPRQLAGAVLRNEVVEESADRASRTRPGTGRQPRPVRLPPRPGSSRLQRPPDARDGRRCGCGGEGVETVHVRCCRPVEQVGVDAVGGAYVNTPYVGASNPPPQRSRTDLGISVRTLRVERGWSQERLSEAARSHVSYLSGTERGRRNVSIDVLARLADALRVAIKDLF